MVDWAIRTGSERILEPSAGDGDFLLAARAACAARGRDPEAWGVELAVDTHLGLIANRVLPADRAINADFMDVAPFPVDVVVGNPPFVRLRHLPPLEAARARTRAEAALGRAMDTDGSLWMPFVLHATSFLTAGGRMALVLPLEATHVKYARPMWQWLGANFASLRLVRTKQRLFPNLLQDVVILLADGRGGTTGHVDLEAIDSPAFLGEVPRRSHRVALSRITADTRPFTEGLLPASTLQVLSGINLAGRMRPLTDHATFNIGYVSGDKRYFHPTVATREQFQLPETALMPALGSARTLRGSGLYTSSIDERQVERLFLPSGAAQSNAAHIEQYIAHGKRLKVDRRYKCATRDPWYVTPDVRLPDVVLPVFADIPVLRINDRRLAASNSYLVGTLRDCRAADFALAWYSTLTLLQLELSVHSLGGGVMVLIPGEVRSIQLPEVRPGPSAVLSEVDSALRTGRAEEAYRAGDGAVLRRTLGLSEQDVAALREGLIELRSWRSRTSPSALGKDVPEQESLLEPADDTVHEGL